MEIIEPEFRCSLNWEELASLFDYKIDKNDQDWTYTIVEAERIDEYIQAYNTTVTNEDSKFSLMEMIIQSLTEQETDDLLKSKWKIVQEILTKDFELNKYTIFYWCCWDNKNIDDCWRITPFMREFWLNRKP